MSQPLESSQHDAIQSKKGLQTVMYTTKIAIVSFLGNRTQYYISILTIVSVHFTCNAEIFKMVVDRYN